MPTKIMSPQGSPLTHTGPTGAASQVQALDQNASLKALEGISQQMKGRLGGWKTGQLRFMAGPDQGMQLERKSWWQRSTNDRASFLDTNNALKNLVQQALGDAQSDRTRGQLENLVKYIDSRTAASKGVNAGEFGRRLTEALRVRSVEQTTIGAQIKLRGISQSFVDARLTQSLKALDASSTRTTAFPRATLHSVLLPSLAEQQARTNADSFSQMTPLAGLETEDHLIEELEDPRQRAAMNISNAKRYMAQAENLVTEFNDKKIGLPELQKRALFNWNLAQMGLSDVFEVLSDKNPRNQDLEVELVQQVERLRSLGARLSEMGVDLTE